MTPSKFKPKLQGLLHKNSFYSVKEFNEYFQNKDEAKPTTEICLHVYSFPGSDTDNPRLIRKLKLRYMYRNLYNLLI